MTDKQRLDFLEQFVNEHGELLLHRRILPLGDKFRGILGLGIAHRTLREAVDQCAGAKQKRRGAA